MKRVLYVTRNGLLEPLGQSQVLAYLRGLSRDYAITLISYEKRKDLGDSVSLSAVHDACRELGIDWRPQNFVAGPAILGPLRGMVHMVWLVCHVCRRDSIDLVHARSYLPAGAAYVAHRLMRIPFVFDMRALWPEELLMAGRIKRGSMTHKALRQLERVCLGRAAGIVSLTHAAVDYLRGSYPRELAGKEIAVIPTCADLDRFTVGDRKNAHPVIFGCIGTVLSGWFRIDWLSAVILRIAERNREAAFHIVTHDDANQVRTRLDPDGRLAERLKISACRPADMPDVVRSHDVSMMFFGNGPGKLGSSPTRMGEVLGSGLPVIASAGIGDVATIISGHKVGVVLCGTQQAEIDRALDELDALYRDPDLAARCRKAAEQVFSLTQGTEKYLGIYSSITGK